MATIRIRFRFICQSGAVKIDRFHNIPRILFDIADKYADPSEEYRQLYSETIRRIMEESEAECLAHSDRTCACGLPAVTTSQYPLLLLHQPEHRVVILVDPLCGREKCRTRARQETDEVISGFRWSNGRQLLDTNPEAFTTILCCKVCARVQGVKRCGRCHAVGYCGKDHQRQDWKIHKAGCILLSKVDKGHTAPATSGTVRPRPNNSRQDMQGPEEEASESYNITFGVSYSGIFTTADGIQYKVSKEEVLAYLIAGNHEDLDSFP
jgi:MYND finger